MRKVFNSASDVIHVFAQQNQNEGRSSNVFFNDNKIYSYGYHYLLGEFIDKNTIVINDSGYSKTTSKHICELGGATSHYKRFYTTETDLKLVLNKILYNCKKLTKARKPLKYINDSLYLWEKLNEFLDYTKNKSSKKTEEYRKIEILINNINQKTGSYKDILIEFNKKEKTKQKRKDTLNRKKQLSNFRNFKTDNVNDQFTYLRFNKEKQRLETSKRVRVELNHLIHLIRMFDSNNLVGEKVNNSFQVATADENYIVVGCHTIPTTEIELIKKELSL